MNNTIKEWEICFVDIDRILNFSSNAGKAMLQSGGETYRVEETIVRICQSFGIDHVDVFATPTAVTSSWYFFFSSSLFTIILDNCIPARLNVLLGAIHVTILSLYSGHNDCKGVCLNPFLIKSECISSAIIHRSYFLHISTAFFN